MARHPSEQCERGLLEQGAGYSRGRASSRRLLLVSMVFAVVLLVWYAPTMIARTKLRDVAVALLCPELNGRLTVGAASLGWFSPVELREVSLRGADESPCLHVVRIRCENTLFGLLMDATKIGPVHLDQPHVQLILRSDGSNLEDILRPLLTRIKSFHSSAAIDLELNVTDGTLEISDADGGRKSTIENLSLSLAMAERQYLPRKLHVSSRVVNEESTGRLSIELACGQADAGSETSGQAANMGQGTLHLSCDGVPLDLLQSVGRRFSRGWDISGRLRSNIQCSWEQLSNNLKLRLAGDMSIDHLRCAAPELLGEDVLQAKSVTCKARFSLSDRIVNIEGATIGSDWGHLDISGKAPLDQILAGDWRGLIRHPHLAEECHLTGKIDLAALARTLPTTLRIRQGTELRSGAIHFELTGRARQDGALWTGSARTTQLAGLHRGRTILWEHPLQFSFTARSTQNGVRLEQLRCDSEFLQLRVEDSLAEGKLTAQGDLTKLARELNKFIDLGGAQLAGEMRATANWRHRGEQRAEAQAQLTLEHFQLTTLGRRPWREERLIITASANGQMDSDGVLEIEEGSLRVTSANDQFDARLTGPIRMAKQPLSCPFSFQLRGDLASWSDRIAPWVSVEDWRLAGTISANGLATTAADTWEVKNVQIELQDVELRAQGIFVQEPLMRIEVTGTWDRARGRWTSSESTLASSALAFRANDIDLTPAAGFGSGQVGFRADLARLWPWFHHPKSSPRKQPTGSLVGRLSLKHENGATAFDGRVDVEPFTWSVRDAATHPSGRLGTHDGQTLRRLWHESHLAIEAVGQYARSRDRLYLQKMVIATDAVRLSAEGQIIDPAAERIAEITGQVQYDLPGITAKLRPYFGDRIQLSGRHTQPFSLRGPLSVIQRRPGTMISSGHTIAGRTAAPTSSTTVSDQLLAETRFGWDAAQLFGFTVGPSEFTAQLEGGTITTNPWNLRINEGRLTISPRLALNARPLAIVLDQESRLDNLRVTPEMCRTWLKYVAPLLADATQAEGRLSVALSGAQVPLADPRRSAMAGTLTIHTARILPGPLAQQLLQIARDVAAIMERKPSASQRLDPNSAWMSMREQQIDIQMADGRVHHRGLEMNVHDVVIRTQGWVGLDQSLSMLAEVPIRDQWVQRDRFLSALRGQSIRIPITGTLSHPKVDRSALRQLSRQLLGGAAERLLQDELQRQLEKLFRP